VSIARFHLLAALLIAASLLAAGCIPGGSVAFIDPEELGVVVEKHTPHGPYFQYAPVNLRSPWRVAVLVHGTPATDFSGRGDARALVERWRHEAEARGVLLVAPAFNNTNFGSQSGPWGGYRSLLGRQADADEFLHTILRDYRNLLPGYDERILLYGHSAGGQMVSRYLVVHPNRVRRAVISAAGSYAWPDAGTGYPNGMAAATLWADWGGTPRSRLFDVSEEQFVLAGQVPTTVVVGTADTEELSGPASNTGANRWERGRDWVRDMNQLVARNRRAGRAVFVSVPGAGHNSVPLTPASISALFQGL
jgi:pimeloyl-ACP methyl ester carboxylesterase